MSKKLTNSNNLLPTMLVAVLLCLVHQGFAQSETEYFNRAAKQYVNEDFPGTGQILAEGLQKYPNDAKLNALLEKLQRDEEDQKKQDQQQQDQDQTDQQDQQDQSDEQKDGEGDEQTDEDGAEDSDEMDDPRGEQSQQEEPTEEPSTQESDLSDREQEMEELRDRLQEMNITPEQAAQILDAMNSNELQFIQQNRKKPTQRPPRGLPEW
ncbi:hypothetical protein [Pleomorphovibrio marinus]|uniref:hypothetical protein n=1 Tax=Pleomorphovibrio marinus TaxID=2164132 RepID=UPI000E0A6070|nr:hypothetical protein [Pleomorphovibrio marinus]